MTKTTPAIQAPTVRFSGQRLRELREAQGFDIIDLAKRLTISTAQLRQLEQDQGSLFYSEAIRLSAARKVADFLGEPLQLLEPEALDSNQLPEPTEVAVVAVNTAPPEPSAAALRAGGLGGRSHRAESVTFLAPGSIALGAVLLSLAILFGLQKFRSEAVALPVADLKAPAVETSQGLSRANEATKDAAEAEVLAFERAFASASASAPAAVPAAPGALAAAKPPETPCDLSSGPVGSFTPPRSVKDPGQIYVRGVQGQTVCVRDDKGQVWRHQFNNNVGRNFSGTAPWVVESAQLMDLEIYFQGARARALQPGSTRLKLMPAKPG